MGTLKHEMEEDAEKNDAGIKVLIAARYYEECICGQIKATWAVDLEDAYKLGNYFVSKNDPLVEVFKGKRRKMTDAIKEASIEFTDWCRCDNDD